MKVLDYERDFILDPSLALYLPLWKKDGTQFMSDDRYGHSFTVTGGVWGPQGWTADGDDDMAATLSAANFTTEGFTLINWVYLSALTDWWTIFCRGDWQGNGWYWRISATGELTLTTNQGGANQDDYSAAATITTGNWAHIAVTRNGATATFYKNGTTATNGSVGNLINPATSANTFYIGRYDDGTLRANGVFGDALIYNRILTLSEIQNNYDATKWRYK